MKILEFTLANYKDFLIKQGYPKISNNLATGEPAPDSQQTLRPFREIRRGSKDYTKHKGVKVTNIKEKKSWQKILGSGGNVT